MKLKPYNIMIKFFNVPLTLAYNLNLLNVHFLQDLQVLGHHITPTGRFPTSKGTEAISVMPYPKNVLGVKRFLGMVGYFHDYVQHMPNRTKHLCALLRKGTPFVWTSAHEAEFTDLKQALLSPETMLYHPDWHSPFELHTDTSKHGVGAMLAQCIMANSIQLNLHLAHLPPLNHIGLQLTKSCLPSSGV